MHWKVGVMMGLEQDMKLYNKSMVYDTYIRIIKNFKEYDKITKKKMIEAIVDFYSDPSHIIDLCTVRELKYLKRVLDKKVSPTDKYEYEWEVETLNEKYLLFLYPEFHIPIEFQDSIKRALKKVNWSEAKKKDTINEILVGICKVYGEILSNVLISMGSAFLNMKPNDLINHMDENALFRYYVFMGTKELPSFDEEMTTCIYFNCLELRDDLDFQRSQLANASGGSVDVRDFINIFYYGFNINNLKVKKFYTKLKSNPWMYSITKRLFSNFILLQYDRSFLEEQISQFFKYSGSEKDLEEFLKLMNDALDEVPSGALNGLSPNRLMKNIEEEEKYLDQLKREIVSQTNACLSKKDTKLFYKLYFALLEFTNKKYCLNNNVKKLYKRIGINPHDIINIIEKLWEEKDLIISQFIEQNPHHFNSSELKMIEEFKKGFRDIAMISGYDEEYTKMLVRDKVYMVKGLNCNIDQIISAEDLPYITWVSLLPFKGQIVYDGLLAQIDLKMGFEFARQIHEQVNTSMKYYHM